METQLYRNLVEMRVGNVIFCGIHLFDADFFKTSVFSSATCLRIGNHAIAAIILFVKERGFGFDGCQEGHLRKVAAAVVLVVVAPPSLAVSKNGLVRLFAAAASPETKSL